MGQHKLHKLASIAAPWELTFSKLLQCGRMDKIKWGEEGVDV